MKYILLILVAVLIGCNAEKKIDWDEPIPDENVIEIFCTDVGDCEEYFKKGE